MQNIHKGGEIVSEDTGNTIKNLGEAISNIGCGITILVIMGAFLLFVFKFCG